MVRLLLEDAECRKLRRWPVLVIEGCEIEAFMVLEGLVGYNLCSEEEVLFLAFSPLSLKLHALFVEALL